MSVIRPKIPESEKAFFDDVLKAFRTYPEMSKKYSLASKDLIAMLVPSADKGQRVISQVIDNKIVTSLADPDEASLALMGCCKRCVDDEGEWYCCESSPNCK